MEWEPERSEEIRAKKSILFFAFTKRLFLALPTIIIKICFQVENQTGID